MATKRYNQLTKEQKFLAFEAVEFVIDKFMPRLKDKLHIRIKGVENLVAKEDIRGDCEFTDENESRAREFVIRVDNTLSDAEFLQTIMHEMVHVKQWAKGEMYRLRSQKGEVYRWCGSKIKVDNMDYYDYPWEIEAHGREYGLSLQFVKKMTLKIKGLI